jgi:putative flippase GtrA
MYSLFIFFNCHYTLAPLFATCLGIFFNFQTIGNLVFKNKNKKLFFKFLCVYAAIYILNVLIIKLSRYIFNLNLYGIGLLSYVVLAPLSFLMQKYLVFKKESLT